MTKERKSLEEMIGEVIVDNGKRYGLLNTFISKEHIQAIATTVREGLPDENEIGFLVYRKLTTYGEEEAKERWTGKHCIEINKDLAEMIGISIAERLNAK